MNLLTTLGIALALAMDAFAVAIATGVSLKQVSIRQTFRLSWHFGLFQALMPIIGWALGSSVQSYMEAYAHWIAFVLLALVGSNMLKEAVLADEDEDEAKPRKDSTKGMTLVMLSVATSIDALAVGFSFSTILDKILFAVVVIGAVTFIASMLGILLGKKTGPKINKYAEILGGSILIIIGLKILVEHLLAN